MTTAILKQIIMTALTLHVSVVGTAQSLTDSIATQELNEIVVQAPKVIRKADMDVYYPSRSAIENSRKIGRAHV